MKQYAIFAAVIAILVGLYVWDQKGRNRKQTIQIVDSLYTAKKRIINYDSIIEAVKNKAMDSIGPILTNHEKRLNLVKNENDHRHEANQAMFKRYDSIVVVRPDF